MPGILRQVQVAVVIVLQRLDSLIESDDLNTRHRQVGQQRLLRQQQPDAAVLNHVTQAFLRVLRVQRHIRTAGLEDGQQADHHLDRTLNCNADQHIRPHPLFAQAARQLVGPRIELRIGEGLIAKHQGGGLRCAQHLRFNQRVQAHMDGVHGARVVPVAYLGVQLAGIQHRQLANPAVGVVDQGPQQIAPVPRHTADGRGVEQIVGIGQRSIEAPAFFPGIEAQVELRGAPFPLDQAQRQPRGRTDCFYVGHLRLVVVHHLKQRVMAQVALQLEGFNQLLERQLLVRLCAERGFLHGGQQISHAGLRIQLAAQHLRVHKKADQPFDFAAVAVGNGHANPHVGLAAVAMQQDVERRQQQHEQRDIVPLCQRAQLLDQRRIDRKLMARAAVAGHGRARVIGGQCNDRVLVPELGLPVFELARLLPGFQPAALPQCIVTVLNGQVGELRLLAALKGVVALNELVNQHVHGPAIRHDVMQGQQQDVLVIAQLDQLDAQQRATGQIEGQ